MLCLVADNEREVGADPIGRIVAARLRAAMKARGWTQGQVHYQANAGQSTGELVSIATVSAILRGAVANPGIGTVMAIARALDLTLDQVAGISPMPEAAPLAPDEDDVDARLRRIEDALAKIGAFHAQEAVLDDQAAAALEPAPDAERREAEDSSPE